MFQDHVLTQVTGESAAALHPGVGLAQTDRRRGCRVPFPAQLLLIWHHDLRNAVRYRIMDASDGGFRIRALAPLVEGMTGMAVKMLPGGEPIDQTVCVAWARPSEEAAGQFEIGLRYF